MKMYKLLWQMVFLGLMSQFEVAFGGERGGKVGWFGEIVTHLSALTRFISSVLKRFSAPPQLYKGSCRCVT